MNHLQPPPMIRTTNATRSGIDYNWLWDNRNNPRLAATIADYFFSPTISQDVRDHLSTTRRQKLYGIRMMIRRIANDRRRRTEERQRHLHQILSEQRHLITDIFPIVFDYGFDVHQY